MTSPTLRIRGLAKHYPSLTVLDGLDLDVAQGSLVALLGASGCGKTTLLRLVAGFDRPDAGSIELDGTVISGGGRHVHPERRRIGVVPQEGAVFPHLSAAANVGFGLARGARRGRVEEMLDLVGMGGLGSRMPHELSGGQLQRVALARALAPRPALVLLDEPFAALDTGLRAAVRQQVREAVKAVGATAVLVTHDQEEALSMADEVAIMASGRVVQQGEPMSVYQSPASAQVAGFLGDAMVLPAATDGTYASSVLGSVRVAGAGAGSGHLVVRPEQVVVLPRGRAGVPGEVVRTQFFGHDAMVTVSVGDPATQVRSRVLGAPVHLTPGTPVSVFVKGEGTYFGMMGG
ncbi:MAG: ABC transporter ATP-binding protein [Jiangellales bacterium]